MIALACYGLVVGPAEAANRWPANVCKDLAYARKVLEGGSGSSAYKANLRFGVLVLQESHCGVSVQAELDADARAISGKSTGAAAPRQPLLCDTTPKAYGGSYTDCF